MPCAPESLFSSDISENTAHLGEVRSPKVRTPTPRLPEKLYKALERSRRASQSRASLSEAHSTSPSRAIHHKILHSDRHTSQSASEPPVLPLVSASIGAPHLSRNSPLQLDGSHRSEPKGAVSGVRGVGVSKSLPSATPFPSQTSESMGVGSSDCQRESPVKSPSSESRLASPGSTNKTLTVSRSPPQRSPTSAALCTTARPLHPPTQSPGATSQQTGAIRSLSTTTPKDTASFSTASPRGAAVDISASPRPVPSTAAGSPFNMDDQLLPAPQATESEVAWSFTAPPDNQRTFVFPEDNNLEFSSQFDSGNLIQVERVGPYRYLMYTAMDCGNSPRQTNNRQWFHFSLRGGLKGATVAFTVVGMAHSAMFTYDWMPVAAVCPSRPQYTRLAGKATVVPLDVMPETPGYPLLLYKSPASATTGATGGGGNLEAASDDDNGSGDDDGEENACSPTTTTPTSLLPPVGPKKKKKKKKKKGEAMNLTFEYRIEVDNPPVEGPYPIGHPLCPAIYIASNHPYSYSTLKRNILTWKANTTGRIAATNSGAVSTSSPSSTPPPPARGSPSSSPVVGDVAALSSLLNDQTEVPAHMARTASSIYFHQEVLYKTLEGREIDLLTITDMHGMQDDRMPLISEEDALPISSATGVTVRPRQFSGKQVVVLTARVHPGECPASHMMHGAIEFLLHPKDPRAMALRQRFVFVLIPMLNPDGVVRGHSRVDADGVDLNRMYQNPTLERHPAPYCVRKLTFPLAHSKKLALFVDMHAHANKKGTFFYGNAMAAADQVQNILYAKLVSLNTPYLDFTSCNFSEANMYAVGRGGKGKESSSRIVLFLETGFVHSYVIETSHVCAKGFNGVVALPSIPGEDVSPAMGSGSILAGGARHSPETFGDTGKACLLALLDLKGANPVSRLPTTPFQTAKGAGAWLQRQMQVEVAEKLFATSYKLHGRVEPKDASQTTTTAVLHALKPEEVPNKVSFRGRSLPLCTVQGVPDFVTLDECVALLAQTPPSGLPRSLFAGPGRQRGASSSAGKSDVPVTIAVPKKRKASRSPASPSGPGNASTPIVESL